MANKPIKVLTEEGLRVLWNQISLDDYPNNDLLIAVLDGIDATKADKEHTHDDSYYTETEVDEMLLYVPYIDEDDNSIITINLPDAEGVEF